ncbi:MAG: TrkA family potassium uptake protein [Oscillospiraceae bacterium]|jgi:trk system potassium uptake protein TrkA|nr:TrkA family potassium uptake protein [Oscillospiraceae bacterium]
MKIMLIGGHQKANFLAKSLKAKGHEITLINEDYNWCKFIANAYDITCIHGDGTKPYILSDGVAADMDVVIALSNNDAANLVSCEIAKNQFGVQQTMAVVNDPKNEKAFMKLGVTKCICATQTITEIIEQEAVVEDLRNFMPINNGKLAVFEVELGAKSPVVGKKLWEIGLPENAIMGMIIRGSKTIIPKGNTKLHTNDRVTILASSDAIEKTSALLVGKPFKK